MILPFTARKRSSKRRMPAITGLTPGPWRSHPSTCISTITSPADSGCNSIFVLAIGASSETFACKELFHGPSRVVNVTRKAAAGDKPRSLAAGKALEPAGEAALVETPEQPRVDHLFD